MGRLALYLRLSLEDGDEKDESNSISNQRKLICEYIRRDSELSALEAVEFSDDGCSGTHMERPGMQELLKEVRANKIQCIIVKDMSRFSRDYIEMGTYLNRIFPFMGVRFIAVNDHYDSREHHGSTIEIDTAFRTLLYDLYSKDVSVKVKASFETKCANGEYVSGRVPFGYEKSREEKNGIVVNPKEAEIVRYIFSLAALGKSSTQIARQLYKENVPTITQFRRSGKEYQDGKVRTWSENAVRKILNNRFYLGEMAYGKSVRKSVGSKRGSSVPVEDWKVIRAHHEALISEEIFRQVSLVLPGRSEKRNREKHPLTGKIYCGGCGYALNYKLPCGKNRYRRFECRKHAVLQIPECCTYLNAAFLEEAVLMMLKKELLLQGDTVRQQKKQFSFGQAGLRSIKKKSEAYRREKRRIQAEKEVLYERYALGMSGREEYQEGAGRLTERFSFLSVKEEEAAGQLAALEKEYRNIEEDKEQMFWYLQMEELTQEAVDIFIKKVYAYKNKRIEIEWNFRAEQDGRTVM